MSETVRYTGTLRLVDWVNTLDESVRLEFFRRTGREIGYRGELQDEFYNEYAVVDEKLYRIEELQERVPEYSFFNSFRKVDCIDFHVMYYNGSMGLEEAIQEATK